LKKEYREQELGEEYEAKTRLHIPHDNRYYTLALTYNKVPN